MSFPILPVSVSSHPLAPYGWDDDWAAAFAPYAEQGLLPAVRAADADPAVIADGVSCRTQVREGSEAEPVHSATVVARALGLRD